MSIKSYFSKIFARQIYLKTQKWASNPEATQKKVFQELILEAKHTAFGEDHHFDKIKTYQDFVKQVPVRDYEELKPYVERFNPHEMQFYITFTKLKNQIL